MRTTLTLDDDVAEQLRETAFRTRKPFKEVVNEVLRKGLQTPSDSKAKKKFVIKTFKSNLRIGIDETKLNQMNDQLDVEHFVAKSVIRRSR